MNLVFSCTIDCIFVYGLDEGKGSCAAHISQGRQYACVCWWAWDIARGNGQEFITKRYRLVQVMKWTLLWWEQLGHGGQIRLKKSPGQVYGSRSSPHLQQKAEHALVASVWIYCKKGFSAEKVLQWQQVGWKINKKETRGADKNNDAFSHRAPCGGAMCHVGNPPVSIFCSVCQKGSVQRKRFHLVDLFRLQQKVTGCPRATAV